MVLAWALLWGSVGTALAQSYSFSYGGRLTKDDGTPLPGPVTLSVGFFAAQSGGTPLGGGPLTYNDVALKGGVFTLDLGLTPAQAHAVFADPGQPVWIEVTDTTHQKTYPRQRFGLVPYALKVPVDGQTVTYDATGRLTLAPGAITDASIAATAAISQSKISGLSDALAGKADLSHTHTLAGDVSGPLSAAVVQKLQGVPVAATAPTVVGQVLKWNGSAWAPGLDLTGGGGGAGVTASPPLVLDPATAVLSLSPANVTTDGYLTAADWAAFSGKQAAITGATSLTIGQLSTTQQNGLELKPYGGGAGQTGELRFDAVSGSNYVALKAPDTIAASRVWTLPAADGTSGQVLKTDGSGNLGWTTPPTVPVASVAGKTGAVTLTTADVSEGANLYYTDTRARNALSATGALAYNAATGVLSLSPASATSTGYLTATDWATFNGKQAALGFTPVNKAGDTMTGALSMGNNALTNLPAPSAAADAATKAYVDAADTANATAMLRHDGTTPLTGAWNVGAQDVTNVGNLSLAAAKTLGLGVMASDPSGLTLLDAGKLWFNSTSGQLKFWDGAAVRTVGNAIGAGSVLAVGTLTTSLQDGAEMKPWGAGAGQTGELRLDALAGGNYVGFKAPDSVTTSRVWTLPATDGTGGQVLKTDGSGTLSWVTPPSQAVASVNGQTGAVTLTSDNVAAGSTNLYYTDTRARNALSATGALAYNAATGVLSLSPASASASGYLTAADWATFNGKQAALGYTPVNKAGDTMTGALSMGGNALTNLAAPSAATDAATKSYVDTSTNGLLRRDGTTPLTGPWNVGAQDVTNVGNLLLGPAKALGFGVFSNAQETTLVAGLTLFDAGKTWFNTSTSQLKFWDGAALHVLRPVGGGLDSLNGLTGGAQTLAVGVAGTSPAWSSAGTTHTLNLPLAATGGVTAGLLSNADYTTFSQKQGAIGPTTTVTAGTVTTAQQDGLELKPWGASAGQTGELRFDALIGTNYVGFKAPDSIGATRLWTLPSADGSNGQVLTTNGSGVLSWATPASSLVTSVAGKTGAVTLSSDDLSAGSTNKFYSDTLARAALGALPPLSYNSTTGAYSLTGTLAVANGGTGASSLTGLLVGNGTSAVTGLTAASGLQYLRSNAGNTGFELATLGTLATQNANAVAITGGTLSGVTFSSKGITDNATSTVLTLSSGGSVGIGSLTPAATLDVAGSMRFNTGSQAAGKVITSDASGNANWQNPIYFGQMCPAGQFLMGFDASGSKLCSALTPTFTDIAAGQINSCGLMSDGTVQCWGYDGNGELGDTLSATRYLPDFVYLENGTGKLTGVTSIATGYYHSCAVSNGSVYCWGYNDLGQLGNGDNATHYGAVKVSGITNAVQVSAGWKTTCARLSDGTAKCWGYGGNGQLGNNGTANSNVPVAVNTLTGITQISTGGMHVCAVKSDNTLWCWGYNNYGQLGTNDATQRLVPTQVTTSSFGTNVSFVTAGRTEYYSSGWYFYDYTCAIKTDSTVWCWGYGGNGELGNNTTSTSYVPVQVLDGSLSPVTGATYLAAGGLASCGIFTGGAVKCWGYNSYSQLGEGTTTQHQTATSVLGLGGTGTLTGATKIAMSSTYSPYAFTMAVLSTGQAVGWGNNGYGQLGDNTATQRSSPVAVHYP